jgi:1-deoxy-D-xylulose-5-phosphate reductoisomerase
MKKLAILGCTGSIGVQTLDIVRRNPDKFKVEVVTAHTDMVSLRKIAQEFKPSIIGITNEDSAKNFNVDYPCQIIVGQETLSVCASSSCVDTVVCAVVGMAGLDGVVAAIKSKKRVALANKESLVCAGEYITSLAKEHNVDILPVDSEHSAVWQCLTSGKSADVAQIILTASGGPFFSFNSLEEFDGVTVEKAIAHPNWKMGKKISVDSATMMNKGLELIEARWLFDCDNVDYIVHPQSIIHSMVKFKDGAIIAQLSNPTMELPIQLALTYPDRIPTATPDFAFDKNLTFFQPKEDLFYLPKLAKDSIKRGKSAPCILNCANEKAVELFLNKKIGFGDIQKLVKKIYENTEYPEIKSVRDAKRIFDEVTQKTATDYKNILRI